MQILSQSNHAIYKRTFHIDLFLCKFSVALQIYIISAYKAAVFFKKSIDPTAISFDMATS